MDNDEGSRRKFVEIQDSPDAFPRGIHKGGGLHEEHFFAVYFSGTYFGRELRILAKLFQTKRALEKINRQETRVVARLSVLGTRIAQADDHER